jgi:hypothetical protein
MNMSTSTLTPATTGLSKAELEAELVNELPAREEMSGFHRWFHSCWHPCYEYHPCYEFPPCYDSYGFGSSTVVSSTVDVSQTVIG